jgi:hypothetical protein
LIGHYKVYDQAAVKRYSEQLVKLFGPCKGTFKETVMLEDYENEGTVTLAALKEAIETIELVVEEELMDFILYLMYSKSESLSKLKYQPLLDIIEGKQAS